MFGKKNQYLTQRISDLESEVDMWKAEAEIAKRDLKSERDKARVAQQTAIHREHSHSSTLQQLVVCEQEAANLRIEVSALRAETGALRQILADITGKDVDELIEAHRKAVRLLAYEEVEVKNGVSEDC